MTAALDLAPDDITAELWRRGELSWKLDEHQLEVDRLFDAWNERRRTPEYIAQCAEMERALDDVWVEEIARRWGKTSKWIVKLTSLGIQRPGAVLTYATAFQKDIGDIIVPLANMLLADGPEDLRPKYQRSKNEGHEGLYFPNGSVIKLVGIDQHPDALRGRFSDGVVISEAGFVRKLENTVRAVLLPQFQRRPWAFLALESSTPEEFDHDFTRVFVPDAEARKAYVKRTIDDNTAIDPAEKARAIRQAGGRGHPTCEREYYCEQQRDPERMLVPEFDEARHVVEPGNVPTHAHCYVGMDPGMRDKFGIVWALWDFERAKLVVQRSYAESNVTTSPIADTLRVTERELWGALAFWNGHKFKPNPYLRVADTDARVIGDLSGEHGIGVVPTAKDDPEAQLYALRNAFLADKIEIWRDSGPLVAQLKAGTWAATRNGRGTDWERNEVHGHFDCVAEGTLIETANGPVPIEQVRPGDYVWTRAGLRRVLDAWLVGVRPTWRLETTAGSVVGTGDHRVWTTDGWKPLADLTSSSTLCAWASLASARPSFSTAGHTVDTQRLRCGAIAFTLAVARTAAACATCIATFGRRITDRFRMAWSSIIATAIRSTTTSLISNWSLSANMQATTALSAASGAARTSKKLRLLARHGIGQRPAALGIVSRRSGPEAGKSQSDTSRPAAYAVADSWPHSSAPKLAVPRVMRRSASDQAWMTSRLPALSVESSSSATSTPRPAVVPAAVLRVEQTGSAQRVYDLTVEGEHEFFANGILVHNCVAALVYLWRNVVRTLNPFPPQHVGRDPQETFVSPWVERKPKTSAAKALERAFSGGNRFRPGRRV